jgi:hypothetical protein
VRTGPHMGIEEAIVAGAREVLARPPALMQPASAENNFEFHKEGGQRCAAFTDGRLRITIVHTETMSLKLKAHVVRCDGSEDMNTIATPLLLPELAAPMLRQERGQQRDWRADYQNLAAVFAGRLVKDWSSVLRIAGLSDPLE